MTGPSRKTVFKLQQDNVEEVSNLISRFWDSEHVLARDLKLATWLYGNADSTKLNFATLEIENSMAAMLGYVPSSRFTGHGKNFFVGGAIWWANPQFPGSGLAILRTVLSYHRDIPFIALGISSAAKAIYERLGWQVEVFDEFSSESPPERLKIDGNRKFRLGQIDIFRRGIPEWISERYVGRTAGYLESRFRDATFFDYKFAEAQDAHYHHIAVYRVVHIEAVSLLRLVEFYSNLEYSPDIANFLWRVAREEDCNAIEYAVSDKTGVLGFDRVGLTRKESADSRPMPYLVSPPVWDWTPTYLATSAPHAFITRADGDQDRPN